MLALVIGWEAYLVLYDVRGPAARQAYECCLAAALAILDASMASATVDPS
jgi:hypothetical protein